MSDIYENPLCTRYSGPEMKKIFSPDTKFRTWRKLWIALAESERELGLGITEEQIAELRAHVDDIDYERARKYEHEVRHDVMAHVKTYGDACPGAKGIIHLGATSCYVTDNADLIIYREALRYLEKELKAAMRILGFADVVEVAIGADLCTVEEAHDFLEEVPEKLDWMGTSCCPAWSMMAKTLFPQFKDNISMALTPMVITARMVKKDHPNARIVFIGPCAAKKLEANRKSVRSDVDFVLTFEELLGMFDAKEIDFKTLEADPADGMDEGSGFGRGFAVGGGVAAAVVEAIKHIDPDREILIEYGDGLKECRKMLAMAKAGKRNGYLLEGMGCPGGCVAGAGTLRPVKESTASVERFKNAASSMSTTESPYLGRLKDVEETC